MITFLYGTYGSGKTTAVLDHIARDTSQGIHTFLLVPEQEAVQSERKTLERVVLWRVMGFIEMFESRESCIQICFSKHQDCSIFHTR